uniref:Zn(2)-C6 fungal-type domain-containing protein n=1 Tax=Mesocestoides corti TaxID=53468 RepID=A0A5K3FT22_MESCO
MSASRRTLVSDARPYEVGPSCSNCRDGYACWRNQCYNAFLPVDQTKLRLPLLTSDNAMDECATSCL